MYSDKYLKFTDKAQADSVLYTVTDEITDEQGVVVQEASTKPNYANIDVIGTIYRPTGEVDAEGNAVLAALDGYHVNVRVVDGEDESALTSYSVVPTVPQRIWG